VIRAVVKSAILQYGWKVMGIEDGFEGLLIHGKVRPLLFNHVKDILDKGGTILGSSNRANPFEYKFKANGKVIKVNMEFDMVQAAKAIGVSFGD
jgi:6-phosphofructokinase 1